MPRVTLTIAAVSCLVAVQPVWAQNVKVTPLGSHDGEFCARDRALVFEDPDGTRILYDAGRTVRGPDDERLGEIDAVLLSHVHGDHLGDVIAGAECRHVRQPGPADLGHAQLEFRQHRDR
jgi:glyoxylase-like metal-dependent hydrolase (beta-lactamase superfamily II)